MLDQVCPWLTLTHHIPSIEYEYFQIVLFCQFLLCKFSTYNLRKQILTQTHLNIFPNLIIIETDIIAHITYIYDYLHFIFKETISCGIGWQRDSHLIGAWICQLNPLTSMSDQDRTSPYNIDTISSRQVMRIKKNLN